MSEGAEHKPDHKANHKPDSKEGAHEKRPLHSRIIEGAATNTWKGITAITGFTWRRIKTTVGGALDATVVQPYSELSDTGDRIEHGAKEMVSQFG